MALTRLWLTDAPLWILDEPFTALDATAMEALTRRPEQHARQGMRHPHHPPAAAAAGLSVAHPAPRRRRWRRAMMRALLARNCAWRGAAGRRSSIRSGSF
nr:Cytochrome c biogenesis ATP-binding export protein CcmA [Klebsiella pneumoniae]